MTKREMLNRLQELLAMRGMFSIDGGNGSIGANDNKAAIQNAINCLECDDATMLDYLTVVKLAYPAIYNTIANDANWLTHRHNRMWVYNNARMIIRRA